MVCRAFRVLDRTLDRGRRYLHHIVLQLEQRNMPCELALLPVVESAFDPFARSPSLASGLWLDALREINRVRGSLIHPGQELLVPLPSGATAAVRPTPARRRGGLES